jgi:hypothetical protein
MTNAGVLELHGGFHVGCGDTYGLQGTESSGAP